MTPNDFLVEVKKYEMLRDAHDESHSYKCETALNSAESMMDVLDVLDDYYFPVLRTIEVSRGEKFSLLKETLLKHCKYFFSLPLTQMVCGASAQLSGVVPALIERNISNNSMSQFISEPVNINFQSSYGMSSNASGYVDTHGLREGIVDSIVLQLMAMA